MDIDFNAKRRELLALWQDSFELCRAFVAAAKAGEATLTASLLKELNGFLKTSSDVLDAAEKLQEAERKAADPGGRAQLEKAMEGVDLSDIPQTYRF
jgi:hypothetical protein